MILGKYIGKLTLQIFNTNPDSRILLSMILKKLRLNGENFNDYF